MAKTNDNRSPLTAKIDDRVERMNELYPGAKWICGMYLRQFSQTFSPHWLAFREWQVLLTQSLEKKVPITDATIQAYMAAWRTTLRRVR